MVSAVIAWVIVDGVDCTKRTGTRCAEAREVRARISQGCARPRAAVTTQHVREVLHWNFAPTCVGDVTGTSEHDAAEPVHACDHETNG